MQYDDEWQDPLKRIITEHAEVSEYTETLKEIISIIDSPDIHNRLNSIRQFFVHNVAQHIAFEERVIFPVIESVAVRQEENKGFVAELKHEHAQLLSSIAEFIGLFDQALLAHDNALMVNLSKIGERIVDITLQHSAKEDDRLIPLIKEHHRLFERAFSRN